MLDIISDLEEAEDKFICLAELADIVRDSSRARPGYSYVADWLLMTLKKIDGKGELPPVLTLNHFFELTPAESWGWDDEIDMVASLLLALKHNNCMPFNHPPDGEDGSYWESNSLFEVGFERSAIKKCLPQQLSEKIDPEVILRDDDSDPLEQTLETVEPEASVALADLEFRGKDTLMEIIAGQATYIGQISGKHIRATGINKSALAKDIYKTLCDFGSGMTVDFDQCRKTIAMALRKKTNLDFGYLNLEGERQFAKSNEDQQN